MDSADGVSRPLLGHRLFEQSLNQIRQASILILCSLLEQSQKGFIYPNIQRELCHLSSLNSL